MKQVSNEVLATAQEKACEEVLKEIKARNIVIDKICESYDVKVPTIMKILNKN